MNFKDKVVFITGGGSGIGRAAALSFLRAGAFVGIIRVNVICPGAIDTNIESSTHKHDTQKIEIPVVYPHGSIPLTGGTPGTSEEVAQLAMFLASDAAAHITGTPIWIDGADSLLQG